MWQKLDRIINSWLDGTAEFIARKPGLLPLIGLLLILINLILQIVLGPGVWLTDSNLLLHLGLIISIIGILLIRPLG